MFWVDEHFDAAGADRIKYVLVVSVYGPFSDVTSTMGDVRSRGQNGSGADRLLRRLLTQSELVLLWFWCRACQQSLLSATSFEGRDTL